MYRTVCYCLGIHLIAVYALNEFDCTESDIIVTETFCDKENTTQFRMKTFTEDILHPSNMTAATFANDGCPFEYEKPSDFNNTFYVECETEISCSDDEEDVTDKTMNHYFLECEDIDIITDNSTYNEPAFDGDDSLGNAAGSKMSPDDSKPTDTRNIVIIASSVAAGLAAVGSVGAALYMVKTFLQSGIYTLSNPPPTAAFSEMP